jgi:hypothetical protein
LRHASEAVNLQNPQFEGILRHSKPINRPDDVFSRFDDRSRRP